MCAFICLLNGKFANVYEGHLGLICNVIIESEDVISYAEIEETEKLKKSVLNS